MIIKKTIFFFKRYRSKFNKLESLLNSSVFNLYNPFLYLFNLFIFANLVLRLMFTPNLFIKERTPYFFLFNSHRFYKNINFLILQLIMVPFIIIVSFFIYLILFINKSYAVKILSFVLASITPYSFFYSHKINFIVNDSEWYSKSLSRLVIFYGHAVTYYTFKENIFLYFFDTKKNINKEIQLESINKINFKGFMSLFNDLTLKGKDFFDLEDLQDQFFNKNLSIKDELYLKKFELLIFFKNNFLKGLDVMNTISLDFNCEEHLLRWDNFILENAPNAVFFYSSFLKTVDNKSISCNLIMGDIEVQGIDLILLKSGSGIKYSGPILKTRDSFLKESTFQEYQSKMMQSISRSRLFYNHQFKEVFFSENSINELRNLTQDFQYRETFCIDLNKDKDELFLNLEIKIRTDIRKALKTNLVSKIFNINDIPSLDLKRMNNVSSLLKNISKLDSRIYDVYLSIVYENDKMISGVFIIGAIYGDTLYYLNAMRSLDISRGGSQSLAIWSVIENRNKNFTKLDFLGSRDTNIRRFFRGFGGKIENKKEII